MEYTVSRLNTKRLLSQALCGLLLTTAASAASAASSSTGLSSLDILQQFNLVVLGSSNSNSNVEGRTYIGGALNGGNYATKLSSASSKFAGLTVQGSASNIHVEKGGAVIAGSLSNSIINNGSTAVLGSSSYSSYNGQGSTTYIAGAVAGGNLNQKRITSLSQNSVLQNEVATAQSTSTTAMKSSLSSLSKTLSTQATTGGYSVDQHSKATFTAKANTSGIAVINLTANDITKLNSTNNFDFNLDNSVTALLFNVSGQSSALTAHLFGSLQKLSSKTLWNFYDATTVTLNSEFAGSVLAPNAALTNNSNILGGVYVNSLTQNALIRSTTFTGATALTSITAAVPEPETYALMGLGLVMLGWRHKKSRTTALATA